MTVDNSSFDASVYSCRTKELQLNDPVKLTQALVGIDSSNPDFGAVPGPGEKHIASFIKAWLEYRGIETHWIEPILGRPSVVGVVRGSGGGKSLMLNGHTDTVTTRSYEGDPLGGELIDGHIYGRGSADMKSGLAAAMIALAKAKALHLAGDVILAAVADEESSSCGTEQLLNAGWRADAALIAEPTGMDIINMHKGFTLFEVDIFGIAAHGSKPSLGVDAICKAGYFLVELDRHAQKLQKQSNGSLNQEGSYGPPSIHTGMIKGGEEVASYPEICQITIERRTVAGETREGVKQQLVDILENIKSTVPDFKYELRHTFWRSPHFMEKDHPFVNLVSRHAKSATGLPPKIRGETGWTDMALLADAGIFGVIWGPKGYDLHAKRERVEADSIAQLANAYTSIAAEYCK